MRRVSAPEQVVRQWTPSPRELDDLELIGMGVLPVDGFSAPTSGDVPALTLTVPRDLAAVDELELLDLRGCRSLAFEWRRRTRTATQWESSAPCAFWRRRSSGPFRRYVRRPADLPPAERLAVPVIAPLTEEATAEVARTAQARGLAPVLVVLTGAGTAQEVSAPGLIRVALAAARVIDGAEVVAVPVAAREDARDDEALQRAVVSAYGSVHLPLTTGTLSPAWLHWSSRTGRRALAVAWSSS
jgi:hypothetical protein